MSLFIALLACCGGLEPSWDLSEFACGWSLGEREQSWEGHILEPLSLWRRFILMLLQVACICPPQCSETCSLWPGKPLALSR